MVAVIYMVGRWMLGRKAYYALPSARHWISVIHGPHEVNIYHCSYQITRKSAANNHSTFYRVYKTFLRLAKRNPPEAKHIETRRKDSLSNQGDELVLLGVSASCPCTLMR